MLILGIDPGSKKTGLALLEANPQPRIRKTRILPAGKLNELDGWLNEVDLVVLERPILKGLLTKSGRNRAATPEGAKLLADMAALNLVYVNIREQVASRELPLVEPVGYYTGRRGENTWLHKLTGLRRPSRSDVRAVVAGRYGLTNTLQEDLLDAVGLALYGLLWSAENAPISA